MPATVSEQITDEVTGVKMQSIGTLHSLTASLSARAQLAAYERQNDLAASVVANAMNSAQQLQQSASIAAQQIASNSAILAMGAAVRAFRMVTDVSAEQAVGFAEQIGSNLTAELKDMGGTLAGIQQFVKEANTTPPQTGTGGAFGSDAGSALLQQIANTQALMVNGLSELSAAIASLKKE
jgi:hypothetical protein